MYDVIVVGARCAGAPTAMLLAQKGHRVLLVDKGRFPSDKVLSTHYLHRSGVAMLKRWGLLQALQQTGCPPSTNYVVDYHGLFRFEATPPPVDGVDAGYGPRRFVLDDILLRAALDAGVECREGFTVEDLVFKGDRVAGITGRTRGSSARRSERAKVVVGADGLRSLVARKVRSVTYHSLPTLTGTWFSYWSDVPLGSTRIFLCPRRRFVAFETNGALTLALIVVPIVESRRFAFDVESNFMDECRENVPELFERLQQGRREERFIGTTNQPNYFRVPAGPGWALVGDAGRHHDSINPSGMTNAFVDAGFAAEAIDGGLTGRKDMDDALSAYHLRRDARWLAHHLLLIQSTEMPRASVDEERFFQKLASDRKSANEFAGAIEGDPRCLDQTRDSEEPVPEAARPRILSP